jgi:hypothetical protein
MRIIGTALILSATMGFTWSAADIGACSSCRVCDYNPELYEFDFVVSTPNPELWEGDLTGWGCFSAQSCFPPISCGNYDDNDEEDLAVLLTARGRSRPSVGWRRG